MHLFGRSQDSVHRTGLNAQGAADAGLLVDDRHLPGLVNAVFRVQRLGSTVQEDGQRAWSSPIYVVRG